jgi:hypothetical protein
MRTFQEILTDAGVDTRGYSGRGMFGRVCLGVETREGESFLDILASVLEDLDGDEILTVADGIRGCREDSMGLGGIVYWPNTPWVEVKALDEGEES